MKNIILAIALLFPMLCRAQITGVGKLKVGQRLTVAQAYSLLADDIIAPPKVTFDLNHPDDSTYAEIKGVYKEIGLEVNLTVFKKKLHSIRVTYASLDVDGAEDKVQVVRHEAFINSIVKKYGNGKVSETHTPYSCTGDKEQPTVYDNANIRRNWQSGSIVATLIIRKQTNALSNRCITSWGMNFAIVDEQMNSSVNKFFRDIH